MSVKWGTRLVGQTSHGSFRQPFTPTPVPMGCDDDGAPISDLGFNRVIRAWERLASVARPETVWSVEP